ncbi:O-antigen ligase family protein [Rhodopirellula halodulae]|uniref:O-antigen ligase family protein n=1 Tax=Rhodopirellula halodulae TaxID=2894198 RepID=UPI001E3157D2|nr:O-antigen ligase family protein [Rhodopirellula sp. JC737]MCC9654427.1 O-antigen ligase family protein [Rhodopirellula sp. JC737]
MHQSQQNHLLGHGRSAEGKGNVKVGNERDSVRFDICGSFLPSTFNLHLHMLSPEISFWIMLTVSLGFAGWFGWQHGKKYALGAGLAASLLAGTWFDITVLNTRINVTMATAIVLLVVYCTHSWREIFRHLGLLDYLIGAITIWHIIVDTYHGEQPLAVAAQAYGQWMLPYAAGRYAFLHRNSLLKLGPVFAIAGAIISLLCVAEACSGTNIWETAFAPRDELVNFNGRVRYGIAYRACGPTRHAIFLSNMLLTLIPFAILMTQREINWFPKLGKRNRLPGLAIVAILTAGIASSLSRGPLITLYVAGCLSIAWLYRPAAWTLLGASLIAAILVAANWNEFIRLIESNEQDRKRASVLVVDDEDEAIIYTGTRNRLVILQVYVPIFLEGGPLGYGTTASTGFPPKDLPGLPTAPKVRKRLGIVDNAFLNNGLRFGWVGLVLFAGLFVLATSTALHLARRASTYFFPLDQRYFIAVAMLSIAFLFEIATVFWSYDYATWMLLGFGTVSGLLSQVKRPDFAV